MSIYATILTIGDEDDSKNPPIVYDHSGVLPSNSDKRGGVFMLAAIPGHITRDGRDNMPDDCWHPWLRVSVFEVESDSFILDKKQVETLRDSLSEWLEHAGRIRHKQTSCFGQVPIPSGLTSRDKL